MVLLLGLTILAYYRFVTSRVNDEPIASDVERINSANDGADLVETNADDTEGAENDVAQGSTDVDGLTALQSASEDLVGRWIGDKPDCLL
ncbi:MAG: hypothetical protein IPH49_05870 [Ignavibacteria bacterium]|nr:hypothetical protein [Ignavibacteria bacterium]